MTPAEVEDILSEPALRYRRNTLAACFVIVALAMVPDINYSNASVFGLKLGGTEETVRTTLWVILSILFVYHGGTFLTHAIPSYIAWNRLVLRPNVIAARLVFWIDPDLRSPGVRALVESWRGRPRLTENLDVIWHERVVELKHQFIQQGGEVTNTTIFNADRALLHVFRWKLLRFWTVEFGLTALLMAWSSAISIAELLG